MQKFIGGNVVIVVVTTVVLQTLAALSATAINMETVAISGLLTLDNAFHTYYR
jgi:hypothetical protein